MTVGGVEGGSTVATILFGTDFSPLHLNELPRMSEHLRSIIRPRFS